MESTDIVFALTGNLRHNSRALKQIRLLRSIGLTVKVLALDAQAATATLAEGVQLCTLKRPAGTGPRFFWEVHRTFSQAVHTLSARVFHASDLYCLRAMRQGADRSRGKLVYDARELYPHVASTAGRPWVRLFWQRAERRDIHAADAVFTVSDRIANHLAKSYGLEQPLVLHNVPEPQTATPSRTLRKRAGVNPGAVVLLHQGSIQKSRGCFLLLDAMRKVRDAVLVFLGDGPLKPELVRKTREYGLEKHVRFLDPVPPDELLSATADADLGITLLEDTCLNHRYALPNKLFEYLMAKVPVLASDLPEIRDVVNRFQVGRLVNPSKRHELVSAIQECVDTVSLRHQWQANIPPVFETYSWLIASQRFTHAYQSLGVS